MGSGPATVGGVGTLAGGTTIAPAPAGPLCGGRGTGSGSGTWAGRPGLSGRGGCAGDGGGTGGGHLVGPALISGPKPTGTKTGLLCLHHTGTRPELSVGRDACHGHRAR
jgi:hypothetical protein